MSPTIRIPAEVYSRLESHSEGFDTPANVIERLLDHFEGATSSSVRKSTNRQKRTRDKTKYEFDGAVFGKGRLVLAVIKKYVSLNPSTSYADLARAFPASIQGSSEVFSRQDDAVEIFERTGHKRHFINEEETISLSDCIVAVSTEWGIQNCESFVEMAESKGFPISTVSG